MTARLLTTALLLAVPFAAAAADDYLDRMAREHHNDHTGPSPAAEVDPAAATSSEEVAYAEIDGKVIKGYLATPAEGSPGAGLVLIHEWWGLNDNVHAMADRFAGEGYAALAVDLYEGEVGDDPDSAGGLARAASENVERGVENLRQATAYLRSDLGLEKVGVLGWCFGGGWSLRAGLTQGEGIDAVVMYYGRVVTDPDQLASLTAPLLGHFGALDTGITVDAVREFEAALDATHHDATIYVYEDAGHAFANPTGGRYNAEAAELAWDRTLAFLTQHLR